MAKPERIRSSVTVKLMVVSAVFLIVPALLYGRFEQADAERKQLMVTNLQMELEGTGVRASIVHPGPTKTSMGWSLPAESIGPALADWAFRSTASCMRARREA